jgi:hypothetical protein
LRSRQKVTEGVAINLWLQENTRRISLGESFLNWALEAFKSEGFFMITFFRVASVGLLAVFGPVQSAQSQKILYSGAIGKKTGIQVITDTTSDTQSDYTDPSYRSFKTYQSQRKLTLGANDFYYRLKVRAPSP